MHFSFTRVFHSEFAGDHENASLGDEKLIQTRLLIDQSNRSSLQFIYNDVA